MWIHFSSRSVDWLLLFTIICLAHASPLIKLLGVALLFVAPSTWRLRIGELGRFYLVMLLLGGSASFYFLFNLDPNYIVVICIGLFFWVMGLLVHSMLYESVTRHPVERTDRTLRVLFYILIAVSFAQYVEWVLLAPSSYSILRVLPSGGIGDHLMSIYTFSSDAMLVYAMLMLYFIHRGWWRHVFFALLALMWTNFMSGILVLLVAMGVYLLFFRSMHLIFRTLLFSVTFLFTALIVYVAWDNFGYAYTLLSQAVEGGLVFRKIQAHEQTLSYALSGAKELFFGAGMGNFSSRAAFLAGGEYVGWYPQFLVYRHEAFEQNHFPLWNHEILSQEIIGMDGTANQPFSVYNQILGEYGLLGMGVFLFFYIGFFLRRWRILHPIYKTMFVFMLGFLLLDYWFEYFSVLIIFEWMMLLAMREKSKVKKAPKSLYLHMPTKITLPRPLSRRISLPFLSTSKRTV